MEMSSTGEKSIVQIKISHRCVILKDRVNSKRIYAPYPYLCFEKVQHGSVLNPCIFLCVLRDSVAIFFKLFFDIEILTCRNEPC